MPQLFYSAASVLSPDAEIHQSATNDELGELAERVVELLPGVRVKKKDIGLGGLRN